MAVNSKDKTLVGAAGEHLVLSRLLSRGLLASQAPRGARKADVLLNPLDGGSPRLIQVKTHTSDGKLPGWHMASKHEEMIDDDLFYCFVDLELNNSSVWVVPSRVVAKIVHDVHAEWLSTPGKTGQQRNDSEMRRIKVEYGPSVKCVEPGWMNKYLEAWDLLN